MIVWKWGPIIFIQGRAINIITGETWPPKYTPVGEEKNYLKTTQTFCTIPMLTISFPTCATLRQSSLSVTCKYRLTISNSLHTTRTSLLDWSCQVLDSQRGYPRAVTFLTRAPTRESSGWPPSNNEGDL